MDIIHLLPDNVANQIAAGEVIQRPASCLKELVENSLDAGATSVQIILRDAGRSLLQVIDNGKGMSETDARMAFERHATSKIREAADLFALSTMGFRGEALASICAVAQVEMLTRREEDELGTLVEIHGSEVLRSEPVQTPVGTNFMVKNLFFNVPARRRFLKTNATELRNIISEYHRIVLVNPQCRFMLVHDDEVLSDLPEGTFKQRIEQVFGRSRQAFTSSLVEVKTDTELVRIRGFIGKPESASKNAQQFFFVNNRYMRHPYFHKAVMTAYQGMLAQDCNPSYFLFFELSPEAIDVNIHPTKTEIKFADEQAIWPILQASVREALGKFNLTPSIDFESDVNLLNLPSAVQKQQFEAPQVHFNPSYNPFEQTTSRVSASSLQAVSTRPMEEKWQSLYEQVEMKEEEMDGFTDIALPESEPFQLFGRYIALPALGGLLLVDQHRAHQTISQADLEQQLQGQHAVMQQLLFPEVLSLNEEQMLLVRQLHDDLLDVGFDLEQMGRTSYAINAVPAVLGGVAPQPVLMDILSRVGAMETTVHDEWRKQIAASMARMVAIPYGKTLQKEEMRDLVKRLMALPEHHFTPDGKAIITILTEQEIEKHF